MTRLTAVITGFGRFQFFEDGVRVQPDPEEIVSGLYRVPLDADPMGYNDGQYLAKKEFCQAAQDLRLSGFYGGPTFAALGRHLIRGTEYERPLHYRFTGEGPMPTHHYLLGTQPVFDVVERVASGEVRVRGLSQRRLLVAKAVLGVISDEETSFARADSETSKTLSLIEDIKDAGYRVEHHTLAAREALQPMECENDTAILITDGALLLSVNSGTYGEYSLADRINIHAGSFIEGFGTSEGCSFYVVEDTFDDINGQVA